MKNKLIQFIKQYAPVEDEQAGILADYALATWQPLPREVKYLHITGGPRTGKTTIGRVMAAVCKTPLLLTGFESQSALFDVLNSLYPATCIIEEDELMMGELEFILKNGYEEGKLVMQIKVKDGEWVPVTYKIFGHKIILGGITFANPAIESRCIRISLISRDYFPNIFTHPAWQVWFRDSENKIRAALRTQFGGVENKSWLG